MVSFLIYFLFHNIAFKNFFKKFKQYKRQKFGFYECGFRPKHEVSLELTLYSYIVCSLVILYEIEGLFLILFLLNFNILCFFDVLFICIYIFLFILGFFIDLLCNSAR